jgi:GDP-L-fucose synthase
MHFVFDLIRKIMQGKYLNSKVELWGDGYQTRELVYVNDFIDTMLKLIESENNTIINIGSGVGNSIRDFANSISKIIGFDSFKIEYDKTKYVGAKSKVLNINKLKKIMPNYKSINLQDGLKNTIFWFYENKEKLFKN